MNRQFTLSSELQQFLSGLQSKALANVVFSISFVGDAPTLPSNPSTVRRSLMFSKLSYTLDATPTAEFNCFIQNLDGTLSSSVSVPRGI